MNIVEAERETYEAMWQVDGYHKNSPGEQLLPLFFDMAKPELHHSFLDAGCGAGRGALALLNIGVKNISLCDLTATGLLPEVGHLPFYEVSLWDNLQIPIHDWVYCCDVLEHIPPTFAMLVVSRLLEASNRGVFLSISLMADNFGVWIGKPLHQTVQSFVQWRDQLNAIGHVVECRDLLHTGVYFVERR
jgi:hypothetical protein